MRHLMFLPIMLMGWASSSLAADFDNLRQLALEEAQDPALGAYGAHIQSTVAERKGALYAHCNQAGHTASPLEVVLSVDAGGDVSVVGTSIDNALARCLVEGLEDQALPAPPQTPFLALLTFDH